MRSPFNIFVHTLSFLAILDGRVCSSPYINETSELIDHAHFVDEGFRIASFFFQPNATDPNAKGFTEFIVPARIAKPECPNKYIQFYLYNRKYSINPVQLNMNSSIKNVYFIKDAKIEMLFHAYVGDINDSPNFECRSQYVQRGHNVISLSYPALTRFNFYPDAIDNVKTIANCSALMIEYIVKNRKDIKLEQFHVIGFSISAQITGQIYKYLTIGQLSHHTALDAAFPGFDNVTRYSVSSRSAKFCDTYMTNAGVLGVPCPWAHVNFVINGGSQQPTCPPFVDPLCNHEFSTVIYCLSVNPENKFLGQPCDGTAVCAKPEYRGKNSSQLAGAYIDFKARGTYCFNTKNIKSITTAEFLARKSRGQM